MSKILCDENLVKVKNQRTAVKINAKTTTPKLPRNLARRTTKNVLTSSRKWLPSVLKKNARPPSLMTNAKLLARTTTSSKPRKTASQKTKLAKINTEKWLLNASKKNANKSFVIRI